MVKYKIKKFGKHGIHIILRKTDGFKEDMLVDVIQMQDKAIQNNTESNTINYNEIRTKLLQDEDFIELLLSKIQEIRRW